MEELPYASVWIITSLLFVSGLMGCVLPILPGHLLILAGAISYRYLLGPEAGIAWWGFLILILIMLLSQLMEILSGSIGAKLFGGSKWSALGALVGGIAGLLFLPFGLLLGPLLGAFLFEKIFAQKQITPSLVAGVGGMMGSIAGMMLKIVFGLGMIAWFLIDVFFL